MRSPRPPSKTALRLMSITDAADYVGVHPRTVRRWISAGRLTGYRAGPRLIRVDIGQLEDLLRPIVAGGPDAA